MFKRVWNGWLDGRLNNFFSYVWILILLIMGLVNATKITLITSEKFIINLISVLLIIFLVLLKLQKERRNTHEKL